jgi:TPR repeat protein
MWNHSSRINQSLISLSAALTRQSMPACRYIQVTLLSLSFPFAAIAQTSSEIDIILKLGINYKENCHDTHYQLQKLAKENHPIACRIVAQNHLTGNGASLNHDIAHRWLERAAILGDLEGTRFFINHLARTKNYHLLAVWQKVWKHLYPDIDYPIGPEVLSVQSPNSNEAILYKANLIIEQIIEAQNNHSQVQTKTASVDLKPNQSITLEDGSTYQGFLADGIPHGLGKKNASNGSYYIGEFYQGMEEGFGSWYDKKGKLIYQGAWSKGKPRISKQNGHALP